MSDPLHDAAVAMLSAPEAPTDVPAEPAVAPTPDAPTDAPAAEPTPVEAPVPVVDEEKALLADLEARRTARQQKQPAQPNTEVAELKQQIAEMKALLATQSQPKDLRALIAQHGEVEGLRQYGIDPLEFFDGFRKHAKGTDPNVAKALQTAAEAKATALELKQRQEAQTTEQQERAKQEHLHNTHRAYLRATEDAKLQYITKLDPSERLEETYAFLDRKQREGDDLSHLDDRQLAVLVDAEVRRKYTRFAGTDPSATTTTTVPATDGAKKPATPALTNDLASQSTGATREMTERERHLAAIRILEQGPE